MADSLQDQLLKAGLADSKRVRKARQQKKGRGRNAQGGDAGAASAAEQARQAQAEKAARDRQTEDKRQARRRAKEIAAQIRQIVQTHRIERAEGQSVYRFTQGARIKEIRVSEAQRDQLARGELAVIGLREGYELVPASIADRIRPLDETAVRVSNAPVSNAPVSNAPGPDDADADDPYADYPVPDDLMW